MPQYNIAGEISWCAIAMLAFVGVALVGVLVRGRKDVLEGGDGRSDARQNILGWEAWYLYPENSLTLIAYE